jgi:hypothetical protein
LRRRTSVAGARGSERCGGLSPRSRRCGDPVSARFGARQLAGSPGNCRAGARDPSMRFGADAEAGVGRLTCCSGRPWRSAMKLPRPKLKIVLTLKTASAILAECTEGSSSGRTTGSGPVNQGSNPCPSATSVQELAGFACKLFSFLFRISHTVLDCTDSEMKCRA